MKIFTPTRSVAAFCIALAFAGCKKSSNSPQSNNGATVYVTGEDNGVAVYWKNGAETKLTDKSAQAYGQAVTVDANGNIYVAGVKSANQQNVTLGAYWVNGKATYLTDSTKSINSYANSLYLSGTDVYVGGYTDNGTSYATYWKNGIANQVGGVNTIAGGIYLSGTDVYLGGQSLLQIGSNASYWKNGALTNLTTIDNSGHNGGSIAATFVSGTDVYMAGDTYDYYTGNHYATYWKNGVAAKLTTSATDAHALSIFVDAGNVYVCGNESENGVYVAKYWKNGTEFNLATSTSSASSIYVFNNYVYIAGYIDGGIGAPTATVWVNGQASQIGTDGSSANGIFVK